MVVLEEQVLITAVLLSLAVLVVPLLQALTIHLDTVLEVEEMAQTLFRVETLLFLFMVVEIHTIPYHHNRELLYLGIMVRQAAGQGQDGKR